MPSLANNPHKPARGVPPGLVLQETYAAKPHCLGVALKCGENCSAATSLDIIAGFCTCTQADTLHSRHVSGAATLRSVSAMSRF